MARARELGGKAVTARPRGSRFYVESRGLRHRERKVAGGEILDEFEDVSDNTIKGGDGCYRTLPTCRE